MNRIRDLVVIAFFSLTVSQAWSQGNGVQNFSLKEAQEYAVQNSYATRSSSFDVEIAKKQVKNYTAVGGPQINASAKYTYFINIPTQLMPDFLTPAVQGVLMQYGLIPPGPVTMGDGTFPVQFGSKNNFTADVSLSQLIFDGTYIVGLKTAKVYVEMTKTGQQKSQQEIREAVAQNYYNILVATENKTILDTNIANARDLQRQIAAMRKSGFRDTVEVDQITLMISQMENALAMTTRSIDLSTDVLKFQMGIDINKDIALTDNLNDLLNQALTQNLVDKSFDPKTHIDHRLLETSNEISKLQYKISKFKYLPTLVGFGSLSYNAQRAKFDFFKSGSDYPWYQSSIVGLSLTVPIFSSGVRYYKVQMDKFTVKKNELALEQADQGLQLAVQSARSEFRMYADDYQSQIKNLAFARRIYNNTYKAYREGVLSTWELTQAHNQFLNIQNNYFMSMTKLLSANSKLNKALNNY